ncbi:MAG: carbohydrate ABC transporter permease [Ktedonobacteraceae bacterium]|nr:carbohydrate ABC transporter permease [Ktedonobacteraceae bacterium]
MGSSFAYPVRNTSAGGKRRRFALTSLLVVVMVLLALVFLLPLFWLLSTALKTSIEIGAFPPLWWPARPQWINFFTAVTLIDYLHFTGNTVVLSTLSATLATFSSALVGFAFARLPGGGPKQALFTIMVSMMMMPTMITVIPTYILFANLGMVGNYWPWVLWGLGASPFFIFLFRQFFASIPQELEDAAIVDGAGYFRIFWQIFLPLAGPVLVTSFMLQFVATWGDWFSPLIFLNPDNTTLGVAMAQGYSSPVNLPMQNINAAGSIIYVLPVLVIFFFAQRFYVRSLVSASLK